MEHPAPRATLLAETQTLDRLTFFGRALTRINGGGDRLYLRKIARRDDSPRSAMDSISDLDFVRSVLNYGDLAQWDELFENGSRLNHAGAMTASARLADAIAGLDL